MLLAQAHDFLAQFGDLFVALPGHTTSITSPAPDKPSACARSLAPLLRTPAHAALVSFAGVEMHGDKPTRAGSAGRAAPSP